MYVSKGIETLSSRTFLRAVRRSTWLEIGFECRSKSFGARAVREEKQEGGFTVRSFYLIWSRVWPSLVIHHIVARVGVALHNLPGMNDVGPIRGAMSGTGMNDALCVRRRLWLSGRSFDCPKGWTES